MKKQNLMMILIAAVLAHTSAWAGPRRINIAFDMMNVTMDTSGETPHFGEMLSILAADPRVHIYFYSTQGHGGVYSQLRGVKVPGGRNASLMGPIIDGAMMTDLDRPAQKGGLFGGFSGGSSYKDLRVFATDELDLANSVLVDDSEYKAHPDQLANLLWMPMDIGWAAAPEAPEVFVEPPAPEPGRDFAVPEAKDPPLAGPVTYDPKLPPTLEDPSRWPVVDALSGSNDPPPPADAEWTYPAAPPAPRTASVPPAARADVLEGKLLGARWPEAKLPEGVAPKTTSPEPKSKFLSRVNRFFGDLVDRIAPAEREPLVRHPLDRRSARDVSSRAPAEAGRTKPVAPPAKSTATTDHWALGPADAAPADAASAAPADPVYGPPATAREPSRPANLSRSARLPRPRRINQRTDLMLGLLKTAIDQTDKSPPGTTLRQTLVNLLWDNQLPLRASTRGYALMNPELQRKLIRYGRRLRHRASCQNKLLPSDRADAAAARQP